MEKKAEAIEDCTKAIELDDKYVKAYLRRAKWYVTRGNCPRCCQMFLLYIGSNCHQHSLSVSDRFCFTAGDCGIETANAGSMVE